MTAHHNEFLASRVAQRRLDAMRHDVSVALMAFLSRVAKHLGIADHVYVVGGAVRNFIIQEPIKDIDVVIDSVALKGKDSAWFARQLQREIPATTNLVTNNYGVAILTVKGEWIVGGENLSGEVIEIANARKESYGGTADNDPGKGYKPHLVEPATIEEDVYRREFTFNTLLWRLLDLAQGPDKAEIIDLTGCGIRDLQNREMRCPRDPDVVFTDDPSRMVRAIKFLIKYGFKIPPDVEASIRRNAEKLKKIPPGHLSNMIITTFYEAGVGKRALVEMDRLGLLNVVREIVTTDKAFREALANWAERHADLEFVFDLMDLGMPVGKMLGFLNPAQKARLREISASMSVDEGRAFVALLEQPGKGINMPGLIQEFHLRGPDIRKLMDAARSVLLDDPALGGAPMRWEARIRELGLR